MWFARAAKSVPHGKKSVLRAYAPPPPKKNCICAPEQKFNQFSSYMQRNIYHLILTETEGNSVFCGPETVDVSRGEGKIDGRGSTKRTAFPRSQSISVLLYISSQRNNKLKNK